MVKSNYTRSHNALSQHVDRCYTGVFTVLCFTRTGDPRDLLRDLFIAPTHTLSSLIGSWERSELNFISYQGAAKVNSHE